MNIQLHQSNLRSNSTITITGSKSETNRLLLLQALFPEIQLKNTSNSDDSEVMLKALSVILNSSPPLEGLGEAPKSQIIDVHHAGTAMRFLTAYFATQPDREVILTGSSRMKERPIHVLVEALNSLGAQISYQEKIGFPPLKIKGVVLEKNTVSMIANTSSQYISALLLIAPKLKTGLKLNLIGEITSLPYIQMTLGLLNEIGVETTFENNLISIEPNTQHPTPNTQHPTPNTQHPTPHTLTIESDWSSASYFYSLVALSEIGTQITLSSYRKNSLQGDSALVEIYKNFGVETVFNNNNSITISKVSVHNSFPFGKGWDGANSPDIAQTIAVTCFGLGIGCTLTGLHTLKIKETDRLQALKTELTKLGATISVTDSTLTLSPGSPPSEGLGEAIKTYQDHRMAMAFAPLALKTTLIIEDAEVVSKSYPDFWNDLKNCGIAFEEIF
ncbi:3-phosphoshikimate 1-carboxyvinyltransferase [Flavobacterium sp.]|jgi:3-phosphoshikimate 1-carboxyvinyltransferase|uniref:3-phosphoshikimate 1-carboxyvinyltransferase n=1 Tax=Flavobacterium sp. TaxID=239 RepID=UPI0037BF9CF1